MPEELQHLLERIQKDGVEKADAEAEQIIAAAKKKSSAIVREAEDKAGVLVRDAESRAKAVVDSSERSLQQAARDIILWVGETLTQLLQGVMTQEVSTALSGETFREMLLEVVRAYCNARDTQPGIDVLLSPNEQKDVADYILGKLRDNIKQGMEIKSDESIVAGFRVSVKETGLQHDFTPEAIADSLSSVVRPRLAEIIRAAVNQNS